MSDVYIKLSELETVVTQLESDHRRVRATPRRSSEELEAAIADPFGEAS